MSSVQNSLVAQAARIRASLFNVTIPHDFVAKWFQPRILDLVPKYLPLPIVATRDFWVSVFQAKIETTISKEGDAIGEEQDNDKVGPRASKAKQSLLRFVPHMLPMGDDDDALYRFVLEHDDFGIHNMSITTNGPAGTDEPRITALYDWETGSLVPALLADPKMAVWVDLTADENGSPSVTRLSKDANSDYRDEYMAHASNYIQVCAYLCARRPNTLLYCPQTSRPFQCARGPRQPQL